MKILSSNYNINIVKNIYTTLKAFAWVAVVKVGYV